MNTLPLFSRDHGVYRFEWGEPERAILTFDLLRAERSGDVTAEIEVASTVSTINGVIHHARVNLVGTRSRQELARHLAGRTNGIGTDWSTIVEIGCREVLRAYRAGAPAVLLRDVAARSEEDTGHALFPLVLSSMPTCIFGDGGSAKTLLAMGIGKAIHTGQPFCGLEPERPRRVGLFDWEFDAAEHRDRLARMSGGAELPDIVYVPCARPLAEDVDRLRRIIARHALEIVIVDSVALACDGPPEAAEVATRFFGSLRELELPALCIAHVNRSGDTERPFGSAFWHNGFRLTWYAKRETDPSPDRLSVGLFAKKSNVGPLPAPMGFSISFGDGIEITRSEVAEVADFAAHVPLRVRIHHELRGGSRTIAELADSLDVAGDSVRKALERGEHREFTRVLGADQVYRWGLAA